MIQSAAYSTAILMIAGSVIQAFLLENGLSEHVVTSYLSVVQIIQVSVMLVMSLIIDKIKNCLSVYAFQPVSLADTRTVGGAVGIDRCDQMRHANLRQKDIIANGVNPV